MPHLNNLIKNIKEHYESSMFHDFLEFISENGWQKRKNNVYYSLIFIFVESHVKECPIGYDIEEEIDKILTAQILRRFNYRIGDNFQWYENTFKVKGFDIKDKNIYIKTDNIYGISIFDSSLRKIPNFSEELTQKFNDCDYIYYDHKIYDKKRINISNSIMSFVRFGNPYKIEINLKTVERNALVENGYMTFDGYELLFLKKT